MAGARSGLSSTALPLHASCRSALPRKPPALNLPERLGAAEHGDGADRANGRQHLEQVPGGVVHEKHKLHGHDRPEECSVRQRCGANGLGEVVEVAAESSPLLSKVSAVW